MKVLQTGPTKTWSAARWLAAVRFQDPLITVQTTRNYSTGIFKNTQDKAGLSSFRIFEKSLSLNSKSFSTTIKPKSEVPEKPDMSEKFRDGGYQPTREKFEDYKGKTILDPEVAHKYCYDIVRKHDYYTH